MRKSQLRWRMFLLALKRVPHDPEARVRIVRVAFLLLYYMCYLLYLRRAYREIGWQGYLFSLLLLLLGLVGAVFISRSNRRADTLTLKLSAHPNIEAGDMDLAAHRQKLADELLRLAALVDRSATEYLHLIGRSGEVQPGVCRRRTLLCTKAASLWDGFSDEEQSLLHSAEGAWPQEAVWSTLARAEDVQLLRWVVGIDQVIPPIALIEQELVSTFAVTADPSLVQGSACIQPWDLRPAQNEAQSVFVQCFAEGISRGEFHLDDETERNFYLQRAQRQTPVVIGSKPLRNVSAVELQKISGLALRRIRALSAVIDYLHTDAEGPFSLRTIDEASPLTV